MNVKMRGLSLSNPFNPQNKPTNDYFRPFKILEKPGRLKDLHLLKD